MSSWFVGLSTQKCINLIKEFNGYPRVIKPVKGSQEAVGWLSSLCYDLKVLTSFGSCPVQTKFRQEYLDVVFNGMISETIVLGLGTCKNDVLKELNPFLFIEDHKENADKAVDIGIDTAIIKTSYNEGSKASYFPDWKSFPCFFEQNYYNI